MGRGLRNWRTTLNGWGAGIGGYLALQGWNIPHDGKGWAAFLFGAALAITGTMAKDAQTGSAP